MIAPLAWFALTISGMALYGLSEQILRRFRNRHALTATERRIAALAPLDNGRKPRA